MRKLLVVVILAGVTACGGASEVPETTVPSTTEATTAESTAAPTTRAAASTTAAPPTTTPSSTTTTTEPVSEIPAIVVNGGVVTGPESVPAALDEEVRFTVTSDVAEEVHVHGYDLHFDLEPGVTTEVRFRADVVGIFEVELEGAHLHIVDVIVEP